jgi:AcrR family transcriptional regulator
MAGLRERKKLATRKALSDAALRLATERGLENVTLEDITAEANVALRTFRNYFASKYEAVAAIGADRARRIGASLVERPAGEPLWDSLTHAVLEHYEGTDRALSRDTMLALGRVLQAPAMRGEYLKVNFEMQNALAAAIAERTGTGVGADMFPQILAGAVTAASQTRRCRCGRSWSSRCASSPAPALSRRPRGNPGRFAPWAGTRWPPGSSSGGTTPWTSASA